MKYILLTFVLVFVIVPTYVFAICSSTGSTVIFVNGILNSQQDANDSKDNLQRAFQEKFGDTNVKFVTGYNLSHLAGAGDLAQSAAQILGGSISDYDFKTILMQVQPEVATRQILLVGHSQGTLYTNSIYEYLITHGVPEESIAVYNVATPAHNVAGNGSYLTSSNDSLISALIAFAQKLSAPSPLPPNIDIPISSDDAQGVYSGHNFIRAYLAGASDKIVSDVSRALDSLTAKTNTDAETCFSAPPSAMGYKVEKAVFAFADPIASGAVLAGGASMKALATAARGFGNAAAVIFAFEANLPRQGGASAPPNQSLPENTSATELKPSTPQTEIASKPAFSLGSAPASLSLERGESPAGLGEGELANLGTKLPSDDMPVFLQLQSVGGGSAGFGGGGSPTPSVQALLADEAGSISNAQPPVLDTAPPDISLSVSECANSLSSDGCLLASSTVSLAWSSAAGDLNHYIVGCENGGAACSNFSFASTTATSTIYTLPADDSTYIFKAKAVDNAGNESAQTTKTVALSARPVIINEAAWAGSSASAADEWIELYNRSSQSVNLANWVLYASDGVPYVNLSGVIFAGGYYLIERTDDNTVSDVAADLVTPFSGSGAGSGLENSGEILVLSHASTTIDQTVLCSNNWCGGSVSGVYPTMERIDPDVAGTDSTNWGTSNSGASNGFIKNGKDSAGAALTATPRARNSLHYLISQGSTLSADRVLKKSWGVYIIRPSENFTVSAGKTLTVGPGVTIKMGDSANLIVDGTLKSDGTAEDNILFTRLSAAGGWRNVRITSNSQNSSVSYTRFKYGGGFTSNIPSERRALFSVIDNSITISNSIFENSFSAGVRLTTSNSAVQNSTFSVGTSTADNVGLYIVGGSPIISGNTFSENHFGSKAEGAAASYTNNVLNNNISYALYSLNGSSTFSGNSGSVNGKNGIALLGTISAAGGTTTLASNPLPYIATSLSYAQIAVGSVLVLEAGARFAGEDVFSRLNVNGSLKLEGANKDSIIFTSLADTAPAQWYGIAVNSGGYMYGGGFTLRYGGRGMGDNPNAIAGIGIFGGSVNLSDGRIENNYQAGMRLYDSSTSTLSNFEFLNHQMPTGNSTAFISANSTIQATNVTFSGNTTDKSPANAF